MRFLCYSFRSLPLLNARLSKLVLYGLEERWKLMRFAAVLLLIVAVLAVANMLQTALKAYMGRMQGLFEDDFNLRLKKGCGWTTRSWRAGSSTRTPMQCTIPSTAPTPWIHDLAAEPDGGGRPSALRADSAPSESFRFPSGAGSDVAGISPEKESDAEGS